MQSTATSQQIGVADATIKQRLVDINAAKLNLSYTVITAPQDGLVSKINIQPRPVLTSGSGIIQCRA